MSLYQQKPQQCGHFFYSCIFGTLLRRVLEASVAIVLQLLKGFSFGAQPLHITSMASFLYRTIFRRNATFWAGIAGVAFFAEIVLDKGVDRVFDALNRGVSFTLGLPAYPFQFEGSFY